MHERENALKEWLSTINKNKDFILTPLAGDASFRRYFRLKIDGQTQIVMDAPPDREDLLPFVHIAQTLAKIGVLTPEIIAMNEEQGFLVLGDFGDDLLLKFLQPASANDYYQQAMQTLLQIQECPISDPLLPPFDTQFMLNEMNLCPTWFFAAYLKLHLEDDEIELIKNTFDWIAKEVSAQPQVFIHRDYHSRNLMLIKKNSHIDLGVIDFQDAMSGPITYDLVSLLKDCYICWPRDQVLGWVAYFYEHSTLAKTYTLDEFIRAFDLCGLQRHIKVLGVFSRLFIRDNKPGYLKDLPLTLKYVLECAEMYEELRPLSEFFQKRIYLP